MDEAEISKPDKAATFINLSFYCFLLTCLVIYISTFLDGFWDFVIYSNCTCTYHLTPNLEILKWFGIYIGRALLIVLPAEGVRFGILGMKRSPTLSTLEKVSGIINILVNSVVLIVFFLIGLLTGLEFLGFLS